MAKVSDPGECPGQDWQIFSTKGERGKPGERGPMGERGPRGERGDAGPNFKGWDVDNANFTITPIMGDGSNGPTLNLRPLLRKFMDVIG